MSHESVWYSRPRNYGKGSREWYVYTYIRFWGMRTLLERSVWEYGRKEGLEDAYGIVEDNG
jgi:hypothetical protein